MGDGLADRGDFAERIRLQLASRYRDIEAAVNGARFAIHLAAPGLDVSLPLAPLHNDCLRRPDRAGELISSWVATIARQLTAVPLAEFAPSRLLWCVRSRSYVEDLGRGGELLTRAVGTDMVAFVSETMPGSVMRGVPSTEWEHQGMTGQAIGALADTNTSRRFDNVVRRLREPGGVPRDGWRLSGDILFQGSVVMVPDILAAFAQKAGGDVILAVPDRSVIMAIPLAAETLRSFRHRVTQAHRDAMNPCSVELLITDGASLRSHDEHGAQTRKRLPLMAWLRD